MLDTIAEERFDRLTRMARRLFGVDVALVSLVDENRQWFKSCAGMELSETPRDISFFAATPSWAMAPLSSRCAAGRALCDNPWSPAHRMSVLCGLPPARPGGRKLGTLCIIDSKPRAFSDEDVEMLVDLALMVEREFSAIEWATVDELTGLSNRRGFMMLAQHSLQLCTRQNIPAALVFIDLDHLKQVNDQLGHAEGDWVLVTFAQHLMKAFRSSDVVARLGGDEFLVLLTNHSESRGREGHGTPAAGAGCHQRSRSAGYDISFSHGLVEFDPKRHHTIGALISEGDSLMYKTKKRGAEPALRARSAAPSPAPPCSPFLHEDLAAFHRHGFGRNRRLLPALAVAQAGQAGVAAAASGGQPGAVCLAAHPARHRWRGPRVCGLWRGVYRCGAGLALGGGRHPPHGVGWAGVLVALAGMAIIMLQPTQTQKQRSGRGQVGPRKGRPRAWPGVPSQIGSTQRSRQRKAQRLVD